jgi:HlyD family secretion protein
MPHSLNSKTSIPQDENEHFEPNLSIQHPNSTHSEKEKPPDLLAQTDDWSYATKELLDTLPRVWTRGLLYVLVAFVGIALPWAMFSQIDEIGTARGRLEPKGKTIKLDAPVAATVVAVKVKEGDLVKVGQSLVELESELVNADLQQQQKKMEGQQNRLNQLELLKNQLLMTIRTQELQNQAQELEKQAQIEQTREKLKALKITYSLQQAEKQAQVEQARQELAASKISHNLATISLQGSQEKYQRYQQAFEQGVISEDRFQEVEQLVKENSERLVQAKSEISQAESRLKEQQSSYEQTIGQAKAEIVQAQLRFQEQERSYQSLMNSGQLALFKTQEQLKNLETEMMSLKAEIAQINSQIESLQFQLRQRVIKSSIEGTVFQLPIKGTGSVVQLGDTIAEIAPLGSSLLLRAQIATSESGSLRIGMPVKIKFDAYPFQDYGVVEGKLVEISPTSKVIETELGQVATYDLSIVLDRTCIPTPKECIALRAGDTATAEAIIRQRRIIDLLLDPFKKL